MLAKCKKNLLNVAVVAALGATASVAPQWATAQDTYSGIRGKILDSSGSNAADVKVTVEDTRTGVVRTYTSNSAGTFFASKLPVGGPYVVTVDGREPVTVRSLKLGDTFNLVLDPSVVPLEEVVVTGSAITLAETAPGPSATFDLASIQDAVAIDRDITGVFSIDPRLSLDPDGGVNCAGKHPRFNSTTLDGVSHNDRFGLNNNGYSTATGMPFPFDGINQISVELAPFDVSYGGFSACNINAVTKSGTNEFHGTVFYEATTNSMRGDEFDDSGETISVADQGTVRRKGISIGGPIIEDKLFFFAAYEDSEQPSNSATAQGYAGSGAGNEREWLSESDFNRIVTIANDLYDYDPGGLPSAGVQEDEKYMLRLDWNINDAHSLAFVYNYYDGFEDRGSDGDDNEFEFANHYYVKGAESTTYTAKLASQWTDAFSTEVYFSSNEMNDSQVTVGPKDFADMQISIGGRTGTVYLGADDSRQANGLNYDSTYIKLTGQYLLGDHIITVGYEREQLDVFNLFVQHSNGGEYDFFDSSADNPAECEPLTAQERLDNPNCGTSGIDKFELGLPSRIYYGSGGGTNIAADAAASFTNTLNTVYIQDEYYLDAANLTIVAGLRYDFFESSDRPNFNPTFTAENGIRNDVNIDDLDILMPRLGVTWEPSDQLSIRGGLGLYSGGNPNVWLSNAWSNDGLTNVQLQRSFDESVFDLELTGDGQPGYDVPQSMVDEVLAVTPTDASNSNIVVIDPNYKQPSEWKFSVGGTYVFENGLEIETDLLHTKLQDAAYYVDLSQDVVGETTTGQPIYDYAGTRGEDNFMLTNSNETATSTTLSAVLRKSFDMGVNMTFGYAFTDSEDISPMTSSTAGSNFSNVALNDINNPKAGTSNYEVEHRFTMSLTYKKAFFGDLETRFGMFGYRQSGQGTSYVMNSGDLEGDGFFGRHLLYVPTGLDDPNVVFADDFDTDAFFEWVGQKGLGSGFVSRNDAKARWTTRFDVKVEQEVPTFIDGTTGLVYLKIRNFGNLLNSDWGRETDAQFFNQEVVDISVNDAGQYVFEEFTSRSVQSLQDEDSVWEARVGLQFNF